MGKMMSYLRLLLLALTPYLFSACLDFTGDCNHPPNTLETYRVPLTRDTPSDTIHVGEIMWLRATMAIPNIRHLKIVENSLPHPPSFGFEVQELIDSTSGQGLRFYDVNRLFILRSPRGTSRYVGPYANFDGTMTASKLIFEFGFEATKSGIYRLRQSFIYSNWGAVYVDEINEDCRGQLVFEPRLPYQTNADLLRAYPDLELPFQDNDFIFVVVP